MSEKDIENAVIKYFRRAGFNCLPDRTRGWSRFSLPDDKVSEPDIIAYRWDREGIVLSIIGIECKNSGSNSIIVSALEQVRAYQRYIPWCYIAAPRSARMGKTDLTYLKTHHNIGYIPVNIKNKPASVLVSDIIDTYPGLPNHNLSLFLADSTRQRIAMLDIFSGIFQKIAFRFSGKFGWVWTQEDVQYQISNYNRTRSVQFGLNIENRRAIEEKVKGRLCSLATWLQEPEFEQFRIILRRKEYPRSRPRTATKLTLLDKACKDFTINDADALEAKMEEYEYHVQFLIQRVLWNENDVLFRQDHMTRLIDAKVMVDELKKGLKW